PGKSRRASGKIRSPQNPDLMHETSIVSSIIRTLELEFASDRLEKMRVIHLKVGVLSNIEPRLLHNAYDAFHKDGTPFAQVSLEIDSVPIRIQCEICNHISVIKNYKFICENCERPSKQIISGEEMLIHKVEFED
ncbi:MAG: hydrogenase maturation nickel metallochaperone HypA, partial [Bacteroidota bacterium]